MTKITYIPGEIANAAIDEHGNRKPVTRTHHIFDDDKGKSQADINKDFSSAIGGLNSQNYVTVDSFNALPDTGEADTVYRVSNWDGTQQDPTVYSEYAWNGSDYVHLSTKTQIGEVFDISAYHATGGTLATYADLSAALDSNNGGGVPQSLQKGGMSVKYVHTSDNKYVQYILNKQTWSTNTEDWSIDTSGTLAYNPEYVWIVRDGMKRLAIALKKDGDFIFGAGVPSQIIKYVQKIHTEGIDNEWIFAVLSLNKKLLFGVRKDGNFVFNGIPDQIVKFVKDYVDSKDAQEPFVSTSFTTKLNEIKNKNIDIPKFVPSTESSYVIDVSSQSDFDSLQDSLSTAIQNDEKNIIVCISEGTYYAYDNIKLNDISDEDLSISFVGVGNVTIISGGNSYSLSNEGATIEGKYIKVPYEETFSLDFKYSNDKGYINTYEQSKFDFCKQLIQVIDETVDLVNHRGQCYIENTDIEDKPASECADLYIQITEWYQSFYYKVTKIENGTIYFECNNLSTGHNVNYNVNNDYGFAHKMPRYRLVNCKGNGLSVENGYIYIPSKYGNVYESKVGSFLVVDNSRIGNLLITGITFRNFITDTIAISNSSHIGGTKICSNTFIGCNSCISNLSVEDDVDDDYNFHFTHNKCKFIYNYCYKDSGNVEGRIVKNIEIAYNIVEDCNLRLNNNAAFISGAKNFYIAHNIFKNERSGYNISVGRWYNEPFVYGVRLLASGIVEFNEIYFDDGIYNTYDQYTLMDTGAIYVFTNNDDISVRYNYIHNIIGVGKNLGIFLDDGSKNVSVFNNLIINSTETYSIESRRVPLAGRDDENTNVSILYNIIDAPCKLEGNPDVSITCIKGRNFITTKKNGVYSFCEKENDYIISFSEINCSGIFLKQSAYNAISSICNQFIISKIHLKV